MSYEEKQNKNIKKSNVAFYLGIAFLVGGLLIFLDQFLKSGWLLLAFIPATGLVLLIEGARTRKTGIIIPGGIVSGGGIGALLAWNTYVHWSLADRIGSQLIGLALGFGLVTFITWYTRQKAAWWAMVPGGIIFSVGACFSFSSLQLLDFILYTVTGTGIVLLAWGVFWKLFGLIIPGSLLTVIGPGVFFAWKPMNDSNSLAQTGIMLVIFSLGWGLIILFSRVITERFVWWPLIPGGVMAMVGWGLYIGGNPGNAVSFIANTGSIGLIIFGLYLLLMKKGIQR